MRFDVVSVFYAKKKGLDIFLTHFNENSDKVNSISNDTMCAYENFWFFFRVFGIIWAFCRVFLVLYN